MALANAVELLHNRFVSVAMSCRITPQSSFGKTQRLIFDRPFVQPSIVDARDSSIAPFGRKNAVSGGFLVVVILT